MLRAYPDDQREAPLAFWEVCHEDMHYMAGMANLDFMPGAGIE